MNFKTLESVQKLRGGYYTPKFLTDYLSRWALLHNPKTLLEPSCGDGAFIKSCLELDYSVSLTGFELDPIEASKAQEAVISFQNVEIYNSDFLSWALKEIKKPTVEGFDSIVGNPPFIRYQYLPTEFQETAKEIFELLDCKFTKHTNAWVPFVLACLKLLNPCGRLAMVLPTEILHVLHAQPFRDYISNVCSQFLIIDPEELWFEGTLQGAVLFMAQKKDSSQNQGQGLTVHHVKDREFLSSHPESLFQNKTLGSSTSLKGKWTKALLSNSAKNILESLKENKQIYKFNTIAKVDVGIVTGANNFFLVDSQTIDKYSLQEWSYPMFGRSDHCPGIIYDNIQHLANESKGKPTHFVWFPKKTLEPDSIAQAYVEEGISQELHLRYKCRTRTPWYSVPSVYSTKIGMLKRSHDAPKLVLNQLEAFTTDTAYRLTPLKSSPEKIVGCFMNSLTALSAELEGRYYGEGVLELVPSEIEKVLLPDPDLFNEDITRLDSFVRENTMENTLAYNSSKILGKLNLSQKDQDILLNEWIQLKNRRQRNST